MAPVLDAGKRRGSIDVLNVECVASVLPLDQMPDAVLKK